MGFALELYLYTSLRGSHNWQGWASAVFVAFRSCSDLLCTKTTSFDRAELERNVTYVTYPGLGRNRKQLYPFDQ